MQYAIRILARGRRCPAAGEVLPIAARSSMPADFPLTFSSASGVMSSMLGRLRRTTRLDVGLALAFAGMAYLVWAVVAGISKGVIQEMINSTTVSGRQLPHLAGMVKVFFVDTGFVIDLTGLAWLALSLALVVYSSRQRIRVSWAWVSAICQSFVAALGAVLVAWSACQPHVKPADADRDQTSWEVVSSISLPVSISIALLVWVTCLVFLLVELARLKNRGPTLRDGQRTNIYG